MDTRSVLDEILQRYTDELRVAGKELQAAQERFEAAYARLRQMAEITHSVLGNEKASAAEIAALTEIRRNTQLDPIDAAVQAALSPRFPRP